MVHPTNAYFGPKETGKSFIFREISPYAILLSGGQGSVTDLFGWKNRKDKPGLVVKNDLVAFDDVAGPNFKSANDKDMYKGYMEQGSFSRGDDNRNDSDPVGTGVVTATRSPRAGLASGYGGPICTAVAAAGAGSTVACVRFKTGHSTDRL